MALSKAKQAEHVVIKAGRKAGKMFLEDNGTGVSLDEMRDASREAFELWKSAHPDDYDDAQAHLNAWDYYRAAFWGELYR